MAEQLITYVPLGVWPSGRPRTAFHEDAPFVGGGRYEKDPSGGDRWVSGKRTSLSKTLTDLERELSQIEAREAIVQIDAANKDDFRRELRRDGVIRDDVRVRSPAVVVSFLRGRASNGPLVFACDHFTRWQDNLRAIALGLESLRRLERYHIAQTGDQYRGWQALPSSTTPALSTNQAAEVLARRSNVPSETILRRSASALEAYRAAAAKTHPDAGGSTTDFQLVQEAKRVLEAHFGATL